MFFYYPCNRCELPISGEIGFLCKNFQDAQRLATELILVLDGDAIDDPRQVGTGVQPERVLSHAIMNLDPYAPPREVIAAGGIVRHRVSGQILCIQRHGVTDLPKGKLDPGESIATCAMRELQEETGATDLIQGKLLGTTVHGYLRSGFFEIKTTYWYAFTSEATEFLPATNEGIDDVFWLPFHQAEKTLGYAPLQNFLRDIRSVFGEGFDGH
ncbi:MAG: NUDIX domain-containing protein [Bacteroidetes bacterium]|nr:NUDIX domain-containing protein [Bacteroidota bacterium]